MKLRYIDLVVGALIHLSKKGIRRVSTKELEVYEKLIEEKALENNSKINIDYSREEYEDFIFEIEGYIKVRKLDAGEEYIMLPTITTDDLRKFRRRLSVDAIIIMNNKEVVDTLLKIANKKYDDYDKEMALEAIDESYEEIRRLRKAIEIQELKIKNITEINGLGIKSKKYMIKK